MKTILSICFAISASLLVGCDSSTARAPQVATRIVHRDAREQERDDARAEFTQSVSKIKSEESNHWGHLSGKLIFVGNAPKRAPIDTKGDTYCAKQGLLTEELLVSPQNNGIKNVLITLMADSGQPLPDFHPEYASTAKKPVRIQMKGGRFEPHVVVKRTGQPLEVFNADPVGHNAKFYMFNNEAHCGLLAKESVYIVELNQPERVPVKVDCSIHGWMSGYVHIPAHPYATFTQDDGSFHIRNLPVGKHKFRLWHELTGYVQDSLVKGEQTNWQRGFEIEIKPGENELGEITVPASNFP
jgi:hypothetical protein